MITIKFTKISITNLEAANLKSDVSEFEDITCKSIVINAIDVNTNISSSDKAKLV